MHPVLVVGAGPVGLTTAAFLALFGIPVHIIDSSPAPTTLSKALVLWRRSLLTLTPLVPLAQWQKSGCNVEKAYFGDEGVVIASFDFDDPITGGVQHSPDHTAAYEQQKAIEQQAQQEPAREPVSSRQRCCKAHALPAGTLITQADVEATLVGCLQDRFNTQVQRSTTLSSFTVSEDGNSVQCMLADAATGTTTQLTASYLVACDGGKSTVRKQLGITFDGNSFNQRWLLGDFSYVMDDSVNPHKPRKPVEAKPQKASLFVCTTAAGLVGQIPVAGKENMLRVIWNCDFSGPAGEPSLADFQALLAQHTCLQIRLTEALWVSEFKINERQVRSYVHHGGRVLLAGDAAHVHSPAGGQGMNTGIQDAANLAWKLALVATGQAPAGHQLLDTYQQERHPVGAQVVRNSGRILRANTVRSYPLRMLRGLALRVLLSIPFVRGRMVAALAGDNISYSNSSLAQVIPAAGATSQQQQQSGDPEAVALNPSSTSAPLKASSATAAAVWGSCKPGAAFPDVSIMLDGVMTSAAELLYCKPGCCGTLVLMPGASRIWQQQQQDCQQESEGNADANTTGAGSASTSSAADSLWPSNWGWWPLNVIQLAQQDAVDHNAGSVVAGAVDVCGLLLASVGGRSDVGVLVRPDGVVAAIGGPAGLKAWLLEHVAKC